jgi:hypothetical protein
MHKQLDFEIVEAIKYKDFIYIPTGTTIDLSISYRVESVEVFRSTSNDSLLLVTGEYDKTPILYINNNTIEGITEIVEETVKEVVDMPMVDVEPSVGKNLIDGHEQNVK